MSALVLGQASERPWWARSLAAGVDAGGVEGGARVDAGAAADAGGLRDAGFTRDAGPDAGTAGDAGGPFDAGRALGDRWESADGGFFDDAGVTDRLYLRVGNTLRLHFPRVLLMSHCDAPLLRFEPNADTIDAVAVDAGTTQCGFWYLKEWTMSGAQPFPDRLFEVHVTPAAQR